jgi:hypothetical protein
MDKHYQILVATIVSGIVSKYNIKNKEDYKTIVLTAKQMADIIIKLDSH